MENNLEELKDENHRLKNRLSVLIDTAENLRNAQRDYIAFKKEFPEPEDAEAREEYGKLVGQAAEILDRTLVAVRKGL